MRQDEADSISNLLQVTLECGEIGRQANGAIMITDGETVSFRFLSFHWTGIEQIFNQNPRCVLGHFTNPIGLEVSLLQVLYTTACCDGDPVPQGGFSPFQVNYTEPFSAAGKTR